MKACELILHKKQRIFPGLAFPATRTMSGTKQLNKETEQIITLKGSVDIVTEFFYFSINR